MTVAEDEVAPSTVRAIEAVGFPVPVRGTAIGELGSELVTVKVPVRVLVAVGVKVIVIAQLAPGSREFELQGLVIA